MQQQSVALDETVGALLVASRALVAVAARSLADAGDVTLPQFRALVVLSSPSDTTVSDLATALDIHPTTATRLVDRLVRKRLVGRRDAPGDRRVTHLVLTARGRGLVERVTERRARHLREIVQRLPAGRRGEVTAAMQAFADAAGEPSEIDLFGWEGTAG